MVTRVSLFFFRVSHLFSVYMYISLSVCLSPLFLCLELCVKTINVVNNMFIFFVCNIVWNGFFFISVSKNFSFIFYNQKPLIWSLA